MQLLAPFPGIVMFNVESAEVFPFPLLTEPNQPVSSLESIAVLPPIEQRYLMVIYIDCYLDSQGRRYVDPLWYKDLVRHLVYLKQFVLASPCRHEEPPAGAIALDTDPRFADMEFVDLPPVDSYQQAILQLPKTFAILWPVIKEADIVHSAVAASYIPPAWLVTPIVRWHRKFYLIVVESAFWRTHLGLQKNLKRQIKSLIYEAMNRWCVDNTDLAIFTQQQYRESLATQAPEQGYIIHASWIDADNILSDPEAETLWQEKLSKSEGNLKVLFAGRLESFKGVEVLLRAMQVLSGKGVPIQLDILGDGKLLPDCEKAQQTMQFPTQIHLLKPVAYGPELFEQLRRYHLVVVPSITDEQPRIVYDAYSQAVPVLASMTDGLQDCVWQDSTGFLFEVGNATALATCLEEMLQNPAQLKAMGLNALQIARQLTHQEMHRKRWQILLHKLGLLPKRNIHPEKPLACDRAVEEVN